MCGQVVDPDRWSTRLTIELNEQRRVQNKERNRRADHLLTSRSDLARHNGPTCRIKIECRFSLEAVVDLNKFKIGWFRSKCRSQTNCATAIKLSAEHVAHPSRHGSLEGSADYRGNINRYTRLSYKLVIACRCLKRADL